MQSIGNRGAKSRHRRYSQDQHRGGRATPARRPAACRVQRALPCPARWRAKEGRGRERLTQGAMAFDRAQDAAGVSDNIPCLGRLPAVISLVCRDSMT